MPRLRGMRPAPVRCERLGDRALGVCWRLGDGSRLSLLANLGGRPAAPVTPPPGVAIYRSEPLAIDALRAGRLPPWSVAWLLDAAARSEVR